MTYNVFGGTLSLTQSINQPWLPVLVCAVLVHHRFVGSVNRPTDTHHMSVVRHLGDIPLVNVVCFESS